MTTTYRADRVFTGLELLSPGYVTVDGDQITAVTTEPPATACLDLGEHDLLPGLVDLHSDCLLQRANPRPGTTFSLTDTLVVLDTEVLSSGITSNFVCVTLQNNEAKGRTIEFAEQSARLIDQVRAELRADHRVHLRVEATTDRLDVAEELAALPAVSLISYMDHTPGQGQFKHEKEWRTYYASEGEAQLDQLLAARLARQPFADAARLRLAELARGHGLALASHDDDSPERVEHARELGVRIAEFPVTKEAAAAAMSSGLLTVMGAPNALRGTSHLAGNLSAREALNAGQLGALASDYHPPSLLAAVYALAAEERCDLVTAISLVTSGPARAAALHDRGVLEAGRRADFVAVRRRAGKPVVAQTWVRGRPVFGAGAAS